MVKVYEIRVSLFVTNCYLVINEETKEGFLIDPGDYEEKILEVLKEKEVKLTAVYLTHGHLDHMMAAERIRKEYGVPVYCHTAELAVLADPVQNLTDRFLRHSYVFDKAEPLSDGAEFLAAGIRVRLLHTPGHTPGGCCYYLPEEGILFAGDTLFHRSVGNTEFPGGSMSVLAESIRKKLYVLPEETVVYAGHGEETDIGSEKRENPYVPAV
ncbi:MAG: MBL fold metallo-hydrolase [Lachnospiraceae bacterium]|nr:MBL fold metallo-hydrolase [Lachnospiraceae bacterium]